ncbi:MAG: zinc ribbon domain-containing protein [Oscillospiraceae bacterium]
MQNMVYYRCVKKRNKSCPNKEIIQERLEEYVLRQLEECIFKEDVFSKLIEDMRANFAAKQSKFVQEMKRLQQAYGRNFHPKS